MSPDRRRLHQWEQPVRKSPPSAAVPQAQESSLLDQHLYTLGMQIGHVVTKVDGLTDEAAAIQRSIDGIAQGLRELDERTAAIERHLAAQEAEARGIRRALGWGATILSGAGVLLGWFLSRFGTVILYSLGLGGSGGGK